ncbi:MAG: hypothetical protein P9L90_04730 [Candidatus Aadella gelida]|nr:hypothetical protein [Candidatus Aadella gelida]
MIKRLLVIVLILGLCLSAGTVYAGGHDKGSDNKVVKKAMMMLKNADELGLSDEQVAKIKAIKIASKKDAIRKDAEIELLKVDIMSNMYGDTIDIETINPLIDKKYDIKKAKAKSTVKGYADLKNVLTADQKVKAKELCKKSKMKCGGKGGMKSGKCEMCSKKMGK